jgi:hypothetical protein
LIQIKERNDCDVFADRAACPIQPFAPALDLEEVLGSPSLRKKFGPEHMLASGPELSEGSASPHTEAF